MSASSSQHWLVPCAEILSVGIPFCVFKLLTGLVAVDTWRVGGYLLIAIGGLDLLLNAVNLVALLVAHRRVGPVCVAEAVWGRFGARDGSLGLAVDVFFSFALVALVIGAGLLPRLSARAISLWNAAVVLNVLGAGAGRLLSAMRRRDASSA